MKTKKQQQKLEKRDYLRTWLTACCRISSLSLSLTQQFILFMGYSIVFKRAGSCMQCGRCCRHVYLRDRGKLISSFHECLEIVQKDNSLRQFSARGTNESGELYFACEHIGRDNGCHIYKKRPLLCRAYPDLSMLRYGAVPKEDCGYYFINRFTGRKLT